eukprot:jgi/Antlo1/1840/1906
MTSEIPETHRFQEIGAEDTSLSSSLTNETGKMKPVKYAVNNCNSRKSGHVQQRSQARTQAQDTTAESSPGADENVVVTLNNDLRSRIGNRLDGRRILGLERHVQLREGPAGIPMIQDTIILEREPSAETLFIFILKLAIFALIVQSIFFIWTRCHKKSSQAFVLLLLYVFPLFLSWAVLVMWMVYLSVVIYYLRFSKSPYLLFSFFCAFLRGLYIAIFVSQVLLLLQFFFRVSIFFPLLVFVISIYFATLSRESVRFLSSITYLPQSIPKDSCFICIKKLAGKTTYTLSCSHSFHSDCIKGWVLIGKKNYCPYCNTHVESMSLSFMEEKFEFFSSLLDYAKNFIVFLLFMYVYFTLYSS